MVGEKSLQISDKIPFKRKVTQTIVSTPFVKLNDGYYNLSAKVKNSNGFTLLQMFATSHGKTTLQRLEKQNAEWKTIEIKRVKIKGGKVEIGFEAEGAANAFCFVDDITFVRDK